MDLYTPMKLREHEFLMQDKKHFPNTKLSASTGSSRNYWSIATRHASAIQGHGTKAQTLAWKTYLTKQLSKGENNNEALYL